MTTSEIDIENLPIEAIERVGWWTKQTCFIMPDYKYDIYVRCTPEEHQAYLARFKSKIEQSRRLPSAQ